MSAALKKILLLSLALVLAFSLVAFVGCKEKLPQGEIDQIITAADAASYDTVSFDMDMPVTVKMAGGSDPGTMSIIMSGTGAIDVVNQAMQMTMDMEMSLPDLDPQAIDANIYILEGWMYTGIEIPGMGGQWLKTELTEAMWEQQGQVEQYVELLATAVEVDYKGIETVNGIECYVFEIEPDMATLAALTLEETSILGMMDLSAFNIAELYKELSVREWLAKDSYLLQRAEIELVFEVRPGDVGATSADFDKMTIDIGMAMRFYAYDQPFTVVLPPEALDAEEAPLSY
jgi:hypothetical protein